ncbi:DUF5318 family protein [Saccharomonospora halophila]|uniref:DUF5318 family protein n=1 Tax=Saccharomonospora halophila TaxID=129922 RepID=UPI000375FD86|nr:DUF5318 family protein [Saccharomonospora halophila]
MRNQRQVVDYALARRAALAEYHSGRASTLDVCDADPYLLRAAEFHGRPSTSPCPVCRRDRLHEVSWVFGDELRHASNSARSPEELDRMAGLFGEFTVYVVEVCRGCGWNHVVLSYVLGTGEPRPRSRRAAGR